MNTAKHAIKNEATFGYIGVEHVTQLALLDRIEDSVSRGLEARKVARLLDHFLEHANAHFLSEQLLMRNTAYAAYEQHVAEHDQLMSEARGFLKSIETSEMEDARDFLVKLRNWLVIHMNTTDAAFESYLEEFCAEDESEVQP